MKTIVLILGLVVMTSLGLIAGKLGQLEKKIEINCDANYNAMRNNAVKILVLQQELRELKGDRK